MSTYGYEHASSTSEEIRFSDGWEMPDLRSPEFPRDKRPKCTGVANHENGLFFPEQHRYQKTAGGHRMTPQIMAEDAKAFCLGIHDKVQCPALHECREWAMTNGERHGVWGGLSEPERGKLKKQREREAVAAVWLERLQRVMTPWIQQMQIEMAEREIEQSREQRVAKAKRSWDTRRRRAEARRRGYWVAPEAERADQEICAS